MLYAYNFVFYQIVVISCLRHFLYIVIHQMYTMETKWLTTHNSQLIQILNSVQCASMHMQHAMLNFYARKPPRLNDETNKTNEPTDKVTTEIVNLVRKIVRLYKQHHSTYFLCVECIDKDSIQSRSQNHKTRRRKKKKRSENVVHQTIGHMQ